MDSQALALATFLVRDHDRAARDVARTRTFPVMTATAQGRLDGIDTALAYMAGQYGHRRVESFIDHVRSLAPRPTPVHSTEHSLSCGWDGRPGSCSYATTESEDRVLDGNR